jgi:hypothetical protein
MISNDDMSGKCNIHVENKDVRRKPQREHLGGLNIDRRIILKLIKEKQVVKMRTGWNCL